MSTKDPNMKVIFGSDTKDFEKGAQAVKQGLKDLDKGTASMLSSLSNAFGVSSAKVEQMTSAVRGLGYRLVETGNAGAKAFGSMLASIGPLQAGIAGLGIAGAIAGFRALKAEADNFKSTLDGMNMSMATAAYISTYKQVLHDANSDTGKAVAQAMNEWEKGLERFKANVAGTFVTSVSDSRWYDAILPTGLIRGWRTVRESIGDATAAADKAERLGSQMADLQKRELEVKNEIAKADLEIAQARREAADKTKTAEERAEAEARYRAKINESYDKQVQLAKAMAIVQNELDVLAENGYDDTKNTLELNNRVLELETEREGKLQSIDKLSANIAKSGAAAASAAQKAREEMQKMAEVQAKWAGLGSVSTAGLSSLQVGVMGPSLSIVPQVDAEYWRRTINAQLGDIRIGIGFEADTQKIQDITGEVNALVESSILRTGELIGNLVGTLAGGGDAWGDFKNAALSAFGDMAIAIGKIAISAGLASEGIKAALKLDNPYVAIAAGAALVALGAAVKSSLSAVASGDYSAGGGGYSGSYSGGSSNSWDTREVTVNVTGTLEADGDKLITVINNAHRKNYYTQ